LAVALARRFRGEIINADSRQVYRHMDIGTAKPTLQEQSQAPHHLLDLLGPGEDFGLAPFLSLARKTIQEIQERKGMPIVAGGTGQYVWALLEGWQVPEVPPDPAFRTARQQEAERDGAPALHRKLEEVDPQRAAQLDPRNVRRVIRALEIYHRTQRRPSSYPQQAEAIARALVIGLSMDRQELYRRIDVRVDRMVAAGLVEEVRRIAEMGYPMGKGPLASPGYRELGQYLSEEITLAEAEQRTKFQTHRLARRQHTWFKSDDPRIRWLDAGSPDLEARAAALVDNFLSGAPAVVK
jgi:tRNA dimethylallyltransferase